MVKVKVEKERKRLHYTTLKALKEALGEVLPIDSTHISTCIARNKKLLEDERIRKLDAEAKNVLEAFIIDTRDKLGSDENVEQVSTEEEREGLRAEFEKSEDWLYEDGKDLTASAYQARKKELEKSTAPVFLRLTELESRPRAVTQAQEAINWTLTILETWAAERPEVTAEERAKVQGMCANFTEWLDDVSAKQEALSLHEPPAFLSSQVTSKLEPVEKEVRRLIKKPKPKPKKVKANATNATDTANATDTVNATEGAAAAEGAESGEDLPPHDEL